MAKIPTLCLHPRIYRFKLEDKITDEAVLWKYTSVTICFGLLFPPLFKPHDAIFSSYPNSSSTVYSSSVQMCQAPLAFSQSLSVGRPSEEQSSSYAPECRQLEIGVENPTVTGIV